MRLRVLDHDVVDSTNERALAAAADGTGRHGDVHRARGQTAGRGRRGRVWESAPGEGLTFSVLLLPPPPAPAPALLTMAAGLGVLEGLCAAGLRGAGLEWPNDVVCDGAKLAGILVESRGLRPEAPHYVVGVGINVRQAAFSAALTAERAVTSLRLQGLDLELGAVFDPVVDALARRLERGLADAEGTFADYLDALGLAGRDVRVTRGDEVFHGALASLAPNGELRIRARTGVIHVLSVEHVGAIEALPDAR